MTAGPPIHAKPADLEDRSEADPENPPELLLQLCASEALVIIKAVKIKDFELEWGDDKQKAVTLELELASSDEQLIPDEYHSAVTKIRAVSQKGPADKTNSVGMSIKHPMKRSTYKMQRKKKAPLIKFSGEPKSTKLTVTNEDTTLKWKVECTVPAGRLLDLVEFMVWSDVICTIEELQLDMWSH